MGTLGNKAFHQHEYQQEDDPATDPISCGVITIQARL
jgi:hypothetical protein